MSRPEPPYGDKDPRALAPREFQLLTDWRLTQMEAKLAAQTRALWTLATGIIVGVVVYFVGPGRPAVHSALALIGLG